IRELKEAHIAYLNLCKLVGEENVAIHTSVHRQGANRADVESFERENGMRITRQFSEEQFRRAPVIVCTHRRWKSEYETGTDRGVRLCNGIRRDLIVIDEEPELERVYVAQPEDVAELASVLTDNVRPDEARAFGFATAHPAADALRNLSRRMGHVKDHANA